ncbi:MAG: flagellar hook-associated protein FlgL [Austwickia sp.]|jgi:flagellar hook-associated protein 3 FlgL|nr:flagellar hook-associated protein FlgL [Austwickia sp.]MBK8436468.1 flagellar hook-associated protein FlgL [Austwickia sp.]MBK9102145.1 flagellar hook-associated protein FlgL [Austwickia sp.]
MPLRITQNSMNRTQLAGLNGSLSRLQNTQEQLTSGKKLNRPSDDPVGTVSAMRLRGEQRQLEQFGENISDGLSRLRTADDTLTQLSPQLNRIRQLVIAGANDTNGPTERSAYAKEITQIKQGMLQLANSQYAGRPVFAGTANVGNAFAPDGSYQGNAEPMWRVVSDAPDGAGLMNVSIPGSDFGGILSAGGAIDQVIAALESDPSPSVALNAALPGLDAAGDAIASAQSTIGARTNRLESMRDRNGRQDDASKTALSEVEDVDFIKAAMDLNIQSTSYNAALQASAKMIQPSLMDFLR